MSDIRVICLVIATVASSALLGWCVFIAINCIAERVLFPEGSPE